MFNQHPLPDNVSFLEKKAFYFSKHYSLYKRKRWYLKHYIYFRYYLKTQRKVVFLKKLKLPLHLSFVRWIIIDLLNNKRGKFNGIYQFVALPGEGKTLSMVAHMERQLQNHPDLMIATNFNYRNQCHSISHWSDMITFAKEAHSLQRPSIIALDEIHVTFDSSDWKAFPQELLALLSFNRKFSLQFLCSSQIYERIPKKVRDIANYTVICKNVLKADRLFQNYYFEKNNYEASFNGKRKKAEFIREFIADDNMYALYYLSTIYVYS